jgi:hypothetical protein
MSRRMPEDQIIQTLFGPEVVMKTCNTCDKDLPISNFYYSSHTSNNVRNQCINCWKKHNGRSNFANVAMFEVR